MGFTRATATGFLVGAVAAIGISMIKVKRPAYLIDLDKRELLTKKETLALINDQEEQLTILRAFVSLSAENAKDFIPMWDLIKQRAVHDPVFAELHRKIKKYV